MQNNLLEQLLSNDFSVNKLENTWCEISERNFGGQIYYIIILHVKFALFADQ